MIAGLPQRAGVFWLLVFAAACAVAERVQVRLGSSSRPGGRVLFSLSCAVIVAVILLFPVAWAVAISGVGMLVGCLLRGQRQAQKVLFNAANATVSAAAGSLVWNIGSQGSGLDSPWSIPWIAAAALVYFALNTGLTAAMVAFVLDLPTSLVWRRNHRAVLL